MTSFVAFEFRRGRKRPSPISQGLTKTWNISLSVELSIEKKTKR